MSEPLSIIPYLNAGFDRLLCKQCMAWRYGYLGLFVVPPNS